MTRGEVYMADLHKDGKHVQYGRRPVLIIQNDKGNIFSPNTIVIPFTGMHNKSRLPTHVTVREGLLKPSIALCEQILTISKSQIGEYIGRLTPKTMQKINEAIKISLSLEE